ncbi:hypothetical protein GQ53DRAFT_833275 [Thozetella sp. PMI_491]|nr:hypothetical protein GQ53DRAFT_833275 [Thozetella sp. PMI_491]
MDLLQENEHFAARTGPMNNIVFNIMVRQEFEALRQRLYQHNIRIILALAPFEIDLISRIREDLGQIMVELIDMREDIRQILRHIVPDWQRVQEAQDSIREGIQIPEHLALRFEEAASVGFKESSVDEFPLQKLFDAFLVHFDSLRQEGETPETQYLNVLKCAWILKRISSSRELRDTGANSHWPSFVRRLEAELVGQLPDVQDAELARVADSTPDIFSIWPPREAPRAVDEVDANEMFEAVQTL